MSNRNWKILTVLAVATMTATAQQPASAPQDSSPAAATQQVQTPAPNQTQGGQSGANEAATNQSNQAPPISRRRPPWIRSSTVWSCAKTA